MHLPKTDEGWSTLATVASAIAALVNVALIGFLARYTIRQTDSLEIQTNTNRIQTEILLRELKQRSIREVEIAVNTISEVMMKLADLGRCLDEVSSGGRYQYPVKPTDWPTHASALVTIYPEMGSLPSQLDAELSSLDAAIARLNVLSATAEIPQGKQEVRIQMESAASTINKITEFINTCST